MFDSIDIVCPGCNYRFSIPKEYSSNVVKCPKCKASVDTNGNKYDPGLQSPPSSQSNSAPNAQQVNNSGQSVNVNRQRQKVEQPQRAHAVLHTGIFGSLLMFLGGISLTATIVMGIQFVDAEEGFRELIFALFLTCGVLSLLLIGLGYAINHLVLFYEAYMSLNFKGNYGNYRRML